MEEAVGYEVAADTRCSPVTGAGAATLELERKVAELRCDRARLLSACVDAYERLREIDPQDHLTLRLDRLTREMVDRLLEERP